MKKVVSILIVFAICLSLFAACVPQSDIKNDTTNITESGSPITPESTGSNSTENTEATQQEDFYNVVKATALSPKFKYASNDNSMSYSVGKITKTDDPIYVIAIRVIIDTNTYNTSKALVIPSLKEDQYWITDSVQSYISNTQSVSPEPKGYVYDTTYIIEYTANPDKDVWVETISGDKVIDLSTVTYDKEIKTSGDVPMYECAMVEDEYGTKQYIIATASNSDYANRGSHADEAGKGWYNFDLIQLGAVENVPTDLEHLSEQFWKPDNVSIEYNGFKYTSAPSEEDNTVYVANSSYEVLDKWFRDVSRYRIKFEFQNKNNDLFKNDSNIYLNFENVRFVFHIDEWA